MVLKDGKIMTMQEIEECFDLAGKETATAKALTSSELVGELEAEAREQERRRDALPQSDPLVELQQRVEEWIEEARWAKSFANEHDEFRRYDRLEGEITALVKLKHLIATKLAPESAS